MGHPGPHYAHSAEIGYMCGYCIDKDEIIKKLEEENKFLREKLDRIHSYIVDLKTAIELRELGVLDYDKNPRNTS